MNTERKCEWCVGFVGPDPIFCKAPARHVDKQCGTVVCDDHAEDWISVWGPESLRELVCPACGGTGVADSGGGRRPSGDGAAAVQVPAP